MADAFTTGLSAVNGISVADAAKRMGALSAVDDEDKGAPPQGVDAAGEQDDTQDIQPGADDAPPADEENSPEEANAAADEDQPPGEDETEEADPADADQPSIEPPRSWGKAEKEAFRALPREHQQAIADRERARDKEIRKTQDDLAARTKAFEADRAAVTQAKDQYEAGIKQLAQLSQNYLAAQFPDIQSWEDAKRIAREDPARYSEWDAARKEAESFQAEQNRLEQERRTEQDTAFRNFIATEARKFYEAAPEYTDPKKAQELQVEARAMLEDGYGFTPQELEAFWGGGRQISLHDHRLQLLIKDATAYHKAKSQVRKPTGSQKKPAISPPQKPGVAPVKGEAVTRRLVAAQEKLKRTGKTADAVELMRAMRRGA